MKMNTPTMKNQYFRGLEASEIDQQSLSNVPRAFSNVPWALSNVPRALSNVPWALSNVVFLDTFPEIGIS